jgi:hypothetical protein
MNDRRGRLLLVALEAARLRTNAHPLPALRSWLDSWRGVGAVSVGMERQGYDASPIPRRLACRIPSTGPHDAALGWSGVEILRYALACGPGGGASAR